MSSSDPSETNQSSTTASESSSIQCHPVFTDPTTRTSRGLETWKDEDGRMNIYIPPRHTASTYIVRFSVPTAGGFNKVFEGVAQESVGLQIRVNATSVQEIFLYDEGPRTFLMLPPQQRDNSLQ